MRRVELVQGKGLLEEGQELTGVDLMPPFVERHVPPPIVDPANLAPFVEVIDG
jgi:hypothetical protein